MQNRSLLPAAARLLPSRTCSSLCNAGTLYVYIQRTLIALGLCTQGLWQVPHAQHQTTPTEDARRHFTVAVIPHLILYSIADPNSLYRFEPARGFGELPKSNSLHSEPGKTFDNYVLRPPKLVRP